MFIYANSKKSEQISNDFRTEKSNVVIITQKAVFFDINKWRWISYNTDYIKKFVSIHKMFKYTKWGNLLFIVHLRVK